jgi:hypothetical protein
MSEHRLTHILHHVKYILYFTFKFNNETLCPPAGTYHEEPTHKQEPSEEVALKDGIVEIRFKTFTDVKFSCLYCIEFLFSDLDELKIEPNEEWCEKHDRE